ncbi:hypothetical protein PsorP6_013262 [Peronosclerospora sorghi]|uniref:Uncharacterized protein n=1 Tax=Peronosclerospora sorghi TaxID=230839 RepID=A0ACC0WF10_9STRA|nr:hypothetical protein PsorP6_013262 [Peronosclerospora sorghi]
MRRRSGLCPLFLSRPITTGRHFSPRSHLPKSEREPATPTTLPTLFRRRRVRIKELLQRGLELEGTRVVVKGWAKTLREAGAGAFAFLELNDSSCLAGVQCVIHKDETEGFMDALASGGVGASFNVEGVVVKSPAQGQEVELKANKVSVYGGIPQSATYPMSKKRHTLEHLRAHAHLRPRSNIHGAAMRSRTCLKNTPGTTPGR